MTVGCLSKSLKTLIDFLVHNIPVFTNNYVEVLVGMHYKNFSRPLLILYRNKLECLSFF